MNPTTQEAIAAASDTNADMALSDITANTVNQADVLTYHDKASEDGKTAINDAEKANSLKRERDSSENDAEGVADDLTKRLKTKDLDFTNARFQPVVFGNRRQAVCEAVTYYNAYNSSLYTQDGVARGLYLDKEARPQDVFKAEVIISTM